MCSLVVQVEDLAQIVMRMIQCFLNRKNYQSETRPHNLLVNYWESDHTLTFDLLILYQLSLLSCEL